MTENTETVPRNSSPSQDYSVRQYEADLGFGHTVPVAIRHYAWRTGSGVHSQWSFDHNGKTIPEWQLNRFIECGVLTPTGEVQEAIYA